MQSNEELFNILRNARSRLLMFDFDGTLVDIAPTPGSIKPSRDLGDLLNSLSKKTLTNVCVISGRIISDLVNYLRDVKGIALAGCHGAEIKIPGKRKILLADQDKIQSLITQLREYLKPFFNEPGIIIELKPFSLAMHFRLAEEQLKTRAKKEFIARAKKLNGNGDMEFLEGKMVLEFKPKYVNKGLAVKYILKHFIPEKDSLCVYFGDDTTDLDAFAALPERSIKVAVGEKITGKADYNIHSPEDLRNLIRRLVK
ncbi:trehalose-phosphatase [bacterium]|nr:trehalose-phosphatase [bacterium]